MKSHITVVHEGNNERFQCEICEYTTGVKSSLKKHMYSHEEPKDNKTQKESGPIMPFLFGGINHVKPIQLTKIGWDEKLFQDQ